MNNNIKSSRAVMVIDVGNGHGDLSSNLDEAVCISALVLLRKI